MRRHLTPFVLAAALAGCQQPKETYVNDAWVRLPAVRGRPASAYFTLHGGKTDATLIGVSSSVVIKSEMHESMREGASMSMRPIARVALPASGTVAFAPGGKHVMLFDVNPGIKPGSQVPFRFTFADGLQLEYDAVAVAAGDPPPTF